MRFFMSLVMCACLCSGAVAEETADPEAVEAQYRTAMEQGALQARRGNVATALARFKRACSLKPMSAEALFRLALTYCDAQMYSAAESTAQKATMLENNHAGAWLVLGTALFHLDREAEAIQRLDKAFQLDKANPHIPYMLGRCYYFGMNDRPQAGEYFKRTLVLDPNYTPAAFMLACCYFDVGMPGQAATYYDAVIKAEPQNNEARFRRALCSLREKHFEEAEDMLLEVVKNADSDFRAHLALADIYSTYRVDKGYAKLHYERYLATAPQEDPDRARAAAALEALTAPATPAATTSAPATLPTKTPAATSGASAARPAPTSPASAASATPKPATAPKAPQALPKASTAP